MLIEVKAEIHLTIHIIPSLPFMIRLGPAPTKLVPDSQYQTVSILSNTPAPVILSLTIEHAWKLFPS